MTETIHNVPSEFQKQLFGPGDLFARKMEQELHLSIHLRGDDLFLNGEENDVIAAGKIYHTLIEMLKKGETLSEQQIIYAITLSRSEETAKLLEIDQDVICHTVSGSPVKPKTVGQKKYVDSIREKMVTFGVGPAGTGKTYLAIAMAVKEFKSDHVRRIILTRPAIEAGEKLGFLPGDLQSKVDPYLRPLYDVLYQMMGAESFLSHLEKGEIEVAPLAYMRGRTLDNAFIILDEAQNTTPAQMKMFLTRLGFNSKCVITGDRTQKDLPVSQESGLDSAMKILRKIDEIGMSELTGKDVVRHPLVQKIVTAYEQAEKNVKRPERRKP